MGSVWTGISRSRHAATTLPRRTPGADGMAMITSSGFGLVEDAPISSVEPITLRPKRRILRFRGSSSMNPIAFDPRFGLRCISRTTIWPPEPAPTTSDSRCPRRRVERAGRSARNRLDHPAPEHEQEADQEVHHDDGARTSSGNG